MRTKTEDKASPPESAEVRYHRALADVVELRKPLPPPVTGDLEELDGLTALIVDRAARRQALEHQLPILERAALVERIGRWREDLVPMLVEQGTAAGVADQARRVYEVAESRFTMAKNEVAAAAQRVNTLNGMIAEAEHELAVFDTRLAIARGES